MESAVHASLVLKLAQTVRQRHASPGLAVLADHASFGADRPWPVAGFIPDVIANDLAGDLEIVAEAKTWGDLETQHSMRQIEAFLAHIALRPNGRFYLGVRWGHEPRAELVMNAIARKAGLTVTAEVLGLA